MIIDQGMQRPNRMADVFNETNRFESIRPKWIGESIRIANRNTLLPTRCFFHNDFHSSFLYWFLPPALLSVKTTWNNFRCWCCWKLNQLAYLSARMTGELTEPIWAVHDRKSRSLGISKHEVAVCNKSSSTALSSPSLFASCTDWIIIIIIIIIISLYWNQVDKPQLATMTRQTSCHAGQHCTV